MFNIIIDITIIYYLIMFVDLTKYFLIFIYIFSFISGFAKTHTRS